MGPGNGHRVKVEREFRRVIMGACLCLLGPSPAVSAEEAPQFVGWTLADRLERVAERLDAGDAAVPLDDIRAEMWKTWAGVPSADAYRRDRQGRKGSGTGEWADFIEIMSAIRHGFAEGNCVDIERDAWALPGNSVHRVIVLLYGARCALARGDGEEAAAYLSMASGTLVVLDRKALAKRVALSHRIRMLGPDARVQIFAPGEQAIRNTLARTMEAWGSATTDEARLGLQSAESRFPAEWIRLAVLAHRDVEEGRAADAEAACQHLLDLLGGARSISDGQLSALERQAMEAVVSTSEARDRASSWCLRGMTLLDAGELDDAGHFFDRSLSEFSWFGPALVGRAEVALRSGDTEAAHLWIQQALAIHPRMVSETRAEMDRLVNAWDRVTMPLPLSGASLLEVTAEAGLGETTAGLVPLDVQTNPGGFFDTASTGGKHVGSGAAFFDYDLDGDLDLFSVNPSLFRNGEAAHLFPSDLYRNDGRGHFEDVAREAGVADVMGGYGVAVADYDADGDPDLYVTRAGSNVLFRNEGDGQFSDVSSAAGVDDAGFGVGAAWLDYDGDGWLDLYVVNFMDLNGALEPAMNRGSGGSNARSNLFRVPQANVLYRNRGDGSFEEAAGRAGARLDDVWTWAAAVADLDGDGRQDVYAANDRSPDAFLRNQGDGSFVRAGQRMGLGDTRAGMGAAVGDVDRDFDQDLVVSYHWAEPVAMFSNEGLAGFRDRSRSMGLAVPTMGRTSWGIALLDLDNDGWLDLYVANGPVARADRVEVSGEGPLGSLVVRGQSDQAFRNVAGDHWEPMSLGDSPGRRSVSRGIAVGDYDDDGRMDLFVTHVHEEGSLLRNASVNSHDWIKVRLIGKEPNRDALGARVEVHADQGKWMAERSGGTGFLGAHAPELHFGLGASGRIDSLVVQWPDGTADRFRDLDVNARYVVDQASHELRVRQRYGLP